MMEKIENFDIYIYQSIRDLSKKSGGPSKTVRFLSNKIKDEGFNIKIITNDGILNGSNSSGEDQFYEKFIDKGNFMRPFLRQEIYEYAKRNFKNNSLRLIHDNGIWLPFNNTICKISRDFDIPLIVSPHGMLEPWSKNYKAFKKKIAWTLYQSKAIRSAKVLHATSEMEASNLKDLKLNIPIALIPNGINLPSVESNKKNYKLSDIGLIDDGRNIMLSLGRIHPKKGLLNLLKAWKRSGFLYQKWRLVLAGFPDKEYLKKLNDYINKNNLHSSVIILGPLVGEDLENIYKNSKIFVLPTYSENFGLVVAEALSYGLPSITTKGAPWSILKKENAGWWCEPNIDELIKIFLQISKLRDKDYKLMSNNASRISKDFNWDLISLSYVKLYKWVLGLESKPDFVI